jgi:hypothetical protein
LAIHSFDSLLPSLHNFVLRSRCCCFSCGPCNAKEQVMQWVSDRCSELFISMKAYNERRQRRGCQ